MSAPILTFAQCTACLARPRVRIGGSDAVATDGDAAGKITDGLTDLGRETVLIYHCFKCPACGTYYRFESVDIGITRLFRITIAEAQGIFTSDEKSPAARKEEARWIEEHYAGITEQAQANLFHAAAVVREYAAETCADEYKKHRDWSALRALLGHSDAAVLMGVLHSFAERPYQNYSLGCPNGFRNKYYASSKPFVEPVRFLREFAGVLCNEHAGIRRFVWCMLRNSYINDDKIVAALRRLKAPVRSRELKELLIDRLWASRERDRKELVGFLNDADAEIRKSALWRMRDLSRERFQVLQGPVDLFLAKIHAVPQGAWSEEMRAYADDPAGPEPEDDPWD